MVIRINDPMTYIANILLGRISKMHGFEGAVTVKLEKTFVDNIPETETVFIEIDGKPVPFFISESDYPGGDIVRLKFDGYESIEKVNEFTGCRVFLTTGRKKKETTGLLTVKKFLVSLPDGTIAGKVEDIITNPGQLLLKLSSPDGREILVPFHEDLIVSIDKRKKTITMDLPDGLLNLNDPSSI